MINKMGTYAVWDLLNQMEKEHVDAFSEIARNDDYGVVIYVSVSGYEPGGGMCRSVYVEADDSIVAEETVCSKMDCERTVSKMYDKYLTSKAIEALTSSVADPDGEEDLDEEDRPPSFKTGNENIDEIIDIADSREDDITDAIYDMMEVVLDQCKNVEEAHKKYNMDEVYEDVKDHILEYLYKKFDLNIYRPSIVEYSGGEARYEDFPYPKTRIANEYSSVYAMTSEEKKRFSK